MRIRRFVGCSLSAVVMGAGMLTMGGTAVSSSAGAATKGPLIVGDICSCTGPEASSLSQTSATLDAWAAAVNAKGGVDGHKVQVIVKDDGYSPANALAAAQSLVEVDHVAVIDDNSDVDQAFAPYVEAQGVPVVGAANSVFSQDSVFFVNGATYNMFNAIGDYNLEQAHIKKVTDFYCAEVAVCSANIPASKADLAKHGIEYSYLTAIGYAAPNYDAQCIAAKQSGATAIGVGDATQIVIKVMEECAAQNYHPKLFSGDGTVATSWLPIPAMEGMIAFQPNYPYFLKTSVTKPMYAALAKYAPGITTSQNFGEIVLETWAAGVEIEIAGATGRLGADPTAAQMLSGLNHMPKGTTLRGLSGPLTFTSGHNGHTEGCFWTMGIHNKKFVALRNNKAVCLSHSLAS